MKDGLWRHCFGLCHGSTGARLWTITWRESILLWGLGSRFLGSLCVTTALRGFDEIHPARFSNTYIFVSFCMLGAVIGITGR